MSADLDRGWDALRGHERERSPTSERYERGELLGQGAMAVVYRARDKKLGRDVAIKEVREGVAVSPQGLERFRREATIVAKLSHPNIVALHDRIDEPRLSLVMELVKGEPLGSILARRGLDRERLVALVEKVARAIHSAHEQGIVHRDLKPANVLVTEEGEPKVTDFGVAFLAGGSTLTKTGSLLGTPIYMAPEQVAGQEASPRTDVHGLGVLLYEALTGARPYAGDSIVELQQAILASRPPPPRALDPTISPGLEATVLRALARDPAARHPSAAAFADDLARRHAPPPRSSGRFALAAGGVVLATLAFLGGRASVRPELRPEEALALVTSAKTSWAERQRLAGQLAECRRAAAPLRALGANGRDWRTLGELEARADRLARAAAACEADALAALGRAVRLDPEAERELAALHFAQFEEAERQGDPAALERARRLVRAYDRAGRFAARLGDEGSLSVETRPAGADAFLFRWEVGPDRRLVARPWHVARRQTLDAKDLETTAANRLGRTPVAATALPAGSWLVLLRREGSRDVRVPLVVEGGSLRAESVALRAEADLPADLVPVPGGAFVLGGDPAALLPEAFDPQARTADFLIARHEVTVEEYRAFLEDLSATINPDEADKHLPNKKGGSYLKWKIDQAGRVHALGSNDRWPVVGVTWADAKAYCRWLELRTRQRGVALAFRLPTSLEWEKAARGVDRRFFPWGDRLEGGSFTRRMEAREGEHGLEPVGSVPEDESPYGVVDAAGSVREWCEDSLGESGFRIVRGGAWRMGNEASFRSASRHVVAEGASSASIGFRVAAD